MRVKAWAFKIRLAHKADPGAGGGEEMGERNSTSWHKSKATLAPAAASSWLSFTSKLIMSTGLISECSRLLRSADDQGTVLGEIIL